MSAGRRDVDLVNGGLYRPPMVLALPIVASQPKQIASTLVDTD